MMKLKGFIKKYISKPCLILISSAVLSALILILSKLIPVFADFFNRYISSVFRFIISKITGILPFSLGEALVLCLPIFIFTALFLYFKVYSKDDIKAGRFVVVLFSCLCFMFTSFVFMFGTGYNGTDLSEKLGLEARAVSYEELEYTSDKLLEELMPLVDEIEYRYDGASVMPYSISGLNDKLNVAYSDFAKENSFIPKLSSRVKILGVSPVMTYTHISGIFTYYTGEANINVNYPDYTIPFTMAHEMAHQRGIAPEDEANFVAFLVCLQSEDSYIRYSGYMTMLDYLFSAMNKASRNDYNEYLSGVDMRIKGEYIAFSKFFSKYRSSVASNVTNAINDTYLKASGEKAGTESYGMVVDLACAYYRSNQK